MAFLTSVFSAAIALAFPALATPPRAAVVRSKHFADYQCNSAMELFKALKAAGAPYKKPTEVRCTLN